MILRIEDTDVERSRQHHAEQIVSALQWLGVEWDEGPVYQSDRLDTYLSKAEELVSSRNAYRCYCTVEDLEAERSASEKAEETWRYSGRCRRAPVLDRGDTPYVIRFAVQPGGIDFTDLIRGEVHFEADLIDDFVIIRSDGNPTYHLSVVVDDIEMGITVVARGDDHLSNTPKHILLFQAFGAPAPVFAHLPLILGSDRKRLSKRSGATSAEEYRDLGILPQALFNFLTLLGWAPGGDREIVTREESVALFDLGDVNKSPAVFDPEKLLWMNGQYLMRMSPSEIEPHLRPFLDYPITAEERLHGAIELNKMRARTLREVAELVKPFLIDGAELTYEEAAAKKHLRGGETLQWLIDLRQLLLDTPSFEPADTEAALRRLAEEKGVGAGKLIHPLRLALTGRGNSPGIFDVLALLGQSESVSRIGRLIDRWDEVKAE